MMITDAVSIPVTDRASWLAMRKRDITASDVAAVCGAHPERSPLQVYYEKFGDDAGDVDNKMMRRGRWLEDGVIAAVKDTYPEWAISKPALYVRSPSFRLGCTPDAMIMHLEAPRILQCKVVSKSVFESWQGELPIYYSLQTITESMLVTPRATGATLAALVIGEFSAELEMFNLDVTENTREAILLGVDNWWADIDAGRVPRAEYDKDGAVLAKMYPSNGVKETVDMTGNNRLIELCTDYKDLGNLIKVREGERDAIKAEIIETIAGNARVSCGPFKISNSLVSVPDKVVNAYSFDRLTISTPKAKG